MEEEGRRRVWSLYGWFCGLLVCGSCFGAVTWAARMMSLVNGFEGNYVSSQDDFAAGDWLAALSYSWRAVFTVTYAIEFLCLSAAKLMVLDRMSDFAAGQHEVARKRWAAGGRTVMGVVVLGNAVGLAANVAAAVHYQKAADFLRASSSNYYLNSTSDGADYFHSSQIEIQLAASIASLQAFCEVAVLLLIVAAFIAAGVFCARRIRAIVRRSIRYGIDAAVATQDEGRRQIRRMVVTIAFVFVAFVLRSVHSTMSAVSHLLQDVARSCPGVTNSPCESCNNVYTHMQQWAAYTPEFQLTIVLISSPLTLLVALWGMTSRQTLHAMKSRAQAAAVAMEQTLLTPN
jgi:hypothetical protein